MYTVICLALHVILFTLYKHILEYYLNLKTAEIKENNTIKIFALILSIAYEFFCVTLYKVYDSFMCHIARKNSVKLKYTYLN